MKWTIQPASDFKTEEIERFTEEAWRAYHVEQGHDLSYDWDSQPVFLIASNEERRIIGVAEGRIGAGVGYLSELIVDRDYRGCGVGGELLAEFEARCRGAGCHKLSVMTELRGPTTAFYEKRGWTREAIFERDRGGNDFVRLVKFPDDAPSRPRRNGDSE